VNIRKRTWEYPKGSRQHRSAWEVTWYQAGRRKRKQFPTRHEAKLWVEKCARERRAQVYGVSPDEGITLKAFYEQLYDKQKEWRTETWRERVKYAMEALADLHDLRLTDIMPAVLDEYRRTRLKDVAVSTVRAEFVALSGLFQHAVRLNYLPENPLRRVEWPREDRDQDRPAAYVPPEELQKLLATAGRDAPLYQFAVATGLRESELVALRWPDVRDGVVTVKGKGRKLRVVPLLPEAHEALQRVPRTLDKAGRVFHWVPSRFAAYGAFQKTCEAVGIGPYRFHDLRHTYASYAAMAGVDLHVIAETMGHSHTTVTKRYAHLSPQYRRREIEKMAGFLKPTAAREPQAGYKAASKKES
jgi:integrase